MKFSIYESLFVQQFLIKRLNDKKFLKFYRQFQNIYEDSFFLKEYLNLYFLATINNCPNVYYNLI
jgi:hypothetical protein